MDRLESRLDEISRKLGHTKKVEIRTPQMFAPPPMLVPLLATPIATTTTTGTRIVKGLVLIGFVACVFLSIRYFLKRRAAKKVSEIQNNNNQQNPVKSVEAMMNMRREQAPTPTEIKIEEINKTKLENEDVVESTSEADTVVDEPAVVEAAAPAPAPALKKAKKQRKKIEKPLADDVE